MQPVWQVYSAQDLRFCKSRIVFYSTGLPADVGIFQCQLLWYDDRIFSSDRIVPPVYQFKRACFYSVVDCCQFAGTLFLRKYVFLYGIALCRIGDVLSQEVL